MDRIVDGKEGKACLCARRKHNGTGLQNQGKLRAERLCLKSDEIRSKNVLSLDQVLSMIGTYL